MDKIQEEQFKIIYKSSPDSESKLINHLTKSHSTHYLKWAITDDLSLRYYFYFEDKPKYNKKWILKTHSTKKELVIEEEVILIELLKSAGNYYVEIMGRYITKNNYSKVVVNRVNEKTLFIKES